MRRKVGWILTMVFAATVLAAGPARAEGIKVAVIEVNKVLNESEAGKAARKKMEGRYEELKKKIEVENEAARKMKEDLDKQKILLGKEKLVEKEEALKAKIAELRELTQKAEKEMQNRQNELTREVLKIVEVQVDKIVKEEKIDLVLERGAGVIHFNPSLDITDKVLALVNKEKPGGN
ncbi:MAG: OmpH family outer membrane protein [Deltaproteobacteria bacterium]|nr:OmpH family outer membrane protein [Deltaproteobacteria bacterium]